MRKSLQILGCLTLFCFAQSTSAHYLWVTIDQITGKSGAANIYFEESPAAGDGHYLDHFTTTSKTWYRTVKNSEKKLLKPSDVRDKKQRWLQAELPSSGPRSVECYGKFGVYSYGKTEVLLHYYARTLDVTSHEDLHELARAEHLALDMVPHDHADKVELTVIWRGKPVGNRTVHIRGPKKFKADLKTDARGVIGFKPEGRGRYTFRTNVEEAISGRDGDRDYSLIRHHATLIMTLPLQK